LKSQIWGAKQWKNNNTDTTEERKQLGMNINARFGRLGGSGRRPFWRIHDLNLPHEITNSPHSGVEERYERVAEGRDRLVVRHGQRAPAEPGAGI
jgi:hypothetical protein